MKETIETIKGTIEKFTANKHDDIDGLKIHVNGKSTDVKFPPHTAKHIMALAKENDEVEVVLENEKGKDDKPHPPKKKVSKLTNIKTCKSFETKSVHPPKPTEGQDTVEMDIDKYKIQKGKKDEVVGIVFKDSLIHIHPKVAEELTVVLEENAPLKVTAKKRAAHAGFVNLHHANVYHAETIKASKTKYELKH